MTKKKKTNRNTLQDITMNQTKQNKGKMFKKK